MLRCQTKLDFSLDWVKSSTCVRIHGTISISGFCYAFFKCFNINHFVSAYIIILIEEPQQQQKKPTNNQSKFKKSVENKEEDKKVELNRKRKIIERLILVEHNLSVYKWKDYNQIVKIDSEWVSEWMIIRLFAKWLFYAYKRSISRSQTFATFLLCSWAFCDLFGVNIKWERQTTELCTVCGQYICMWKVSI